ncbi:MAG: hypothetical protein WC951_08785 [Bacteroidales bacterium]
MDKHKNPSVITINSAINEFAEVFMGIDNQILQLHQCSSDDFLGLNADFKQYYHQAKEISTNATQIFNNLAEKESKQILSDLEDLYESLKKVQVKFSEQLNRAIALLQSIADFQRKLFFPVKNLNQDLLTLKFLLANIEISNSTMSIPKNGNFEKLIKRYNTVISQFKDHGLQSEAHLSKLRVDVTLSLKHFESIKEKNLNDLDTILNNIHYGIILFAEKHEEVARQIPQLTKETEHSSQSIADIITNLQYHDIIRQKMDHVQATHKKLLNDLLETTGDSKDGDNEHNQKLLIRVRDIANLQSAQLVHANKEYQKAIEAITIKFIAISRDMATIATMCKEINFSQDNTDELYLQNLAQKMQNASIVLNSFTDASKTYEQHVKQLNHQIVSTQESVLTFSKSLTDLREITAQTLTVLKSIQTNQHLSQTIGQVETLYDDVEKFEGTIQQVFRNIVSISGELLPKIEQDIDPGNGESLIKKAANSVSGLINQLGQKNFVIKSLLDQNLTSSKNIAVNVKESINKIKYYDFFERIIVDIIAEFNRIHAMLKSEIDLGDDKTTDEFSTIKDSYTMASEHKIYDSVTHNEGEVDLFGFEENESDDDDNLELF